jgi:hypothetical protein
MFTVNIAKPSSHAIADKPCPPSYLFLSVNQWQYSYEMVSIKEE